ncbi:MAG: type II toxin-antitoxin system RelE/ParE family toxin [Verrucomicrobiota bacterium]
MPKSESAANGDAPGKMPDYFYSPEARCDLLEIWDFIALDDLDTADRIEREIQEAISILVRNPQLGHLRRDLTSKPVRFWPIYSYLIIYDPAARPLEVVRILSGYRDLVTLLK